MTARYAGARSRVSGVVRRAWPALWKGLASALAVSLLVVVPLRWVAPPTTAFMLRSDARAPDGEAHHHWLDWPDISPHVAIAVVAAEDQKFAGHFGFDLDSIRSAIEENKVRDLPRGASTISQQVAKNLFLWPGRSLLRKAIEAWFTVLIELSWPKQRILEVYLNVAEFGPGVFGIGAASEAFLHKPAAAVGPDEAALLAAVLPNPWLMSVSRPSTYVLERADEIEDQVRKIGGTAYLDDL